jgi:hypothetical protein
MFTVSLESLRSAVRSVLPLVGESHRGAGMGCFAVVDNSVFCVSGSFQTKLAGARLCDAEDGYEKIINKFVNFRDLHNFLSVSFAGNNVKITATGASLKFALGIDEVMLRFVGDDAFSGFLRMPSRSDALQLENYSAILSVCNAAVNGSNQMNPKLSGVYVTIGSRLQMTAVDGYIMGYSAMDNNAHPPVDALIQADFLSYATKLYWDTDPMLRIVDGKAWLFTDSFFAFSPLMADPEGYPGKLMIEELGKEPDNRASVDTAMILDRLGAFINVDYRGKNEVYSISAVNFDFDSDKGMLALSAKSAEGAVEGAGLHIPFTGDPGRWIINMNSVKKIGTIFKNLISSSELVFSLHENDQWMIVRPNNNNDIVFGIVPMRF